jgi:hypothetical protein
MFRLYKDVVTIKRLVQTGSKSAMTDTLLTYKGYLTTPGSDYKSAGLDRFSGSYIFQTEPNADIKI